jgi:undecaprenyl-diphosphatase
MALAPTRPRLSFPRIAALDERTLRRVAAARTGLWTAFMRFFTHTGVWLTLLLVVVAAFGQRSFLHAAGAAGLAAGVTATLAQLIKQTVRRARPSVAYSVAKTLDKYSFPSGHSSAAFAVVASSFFLCPVAFPVILLVAAVVAFSRVYLGVHYPSDVVTGAVMGLLLGAVTAGSGFAAGMVAIFLG